MFNRLLRDGKTLQVLSEVAFSEILEDLCNIGSDVRTSTGLSSYYLIDDKTVLLRFGLPDCGVVIRDNGFVQDRVNQFACHFERSNKLNVKGIEG